MRNDKPIYSKILAEQSKIKHGFFTRNGGVSSGEFGTLNCSFKSKDKNKNIFKNREIVCLYHDQKPNNKHLSGFEEFCLIFCTWLAANSEFLVGQPSLVG